MSKVKIIVAFIIGNLLIAGGIFCLFNAHDAMTNANTLTNAEKALEAKIDIFNAAVDAIGNGAISNQLVPATIGDSYPINVVSRIPLDVAGAASPSAKSFSLNTIVSAAAILNSSALTNPTGVAQPVVFNLAHTTAFSRVEIPLSQPNTGVNAMCFNASTGCTATQMSSYCQTKFAGSDVVYNGTGCPPPASADAAATTSSADGMVCGICVYTAYLSSYCAVVKVSGGGGGGTPSTASSTSTTSSAAPTTTGNPTTTTAEATTAATATGASTNTSTTPVIARFVVGDNVSTEDVTTSSSPSDVTTAETTTAAEVTTAETTTSVSSTTSTSVTTTVPPTTTVVPSYNFEEDAAMPSCRYPFISSNDTNANQRYMSFTRPQGVLFQVVLNVDPYVVLERVTEGTDAFAGLPLPSRTDINNRWRNDTPAIALLVIGVIMTVMGLATIVAGFIACKRTGAFSKDAAKYKLMDGEGGTHINDSAYSSSTLETVRFQQNER